MLAASQLGITICSLLLGRLGEPAVAHLSSGRSAWLGLPDGCWRRWRSRSRWCSSWSAHMVLGEMVPKNIAIAGPERTAIWLVPPFLAVHHRVRPVIEPVQPIAATVVLRLLRVQPRDELETAFTSGELADLIAESRREGLLDDARLAAAHPHPVLGGRTPSPTCWCPASSWCRCRSGPVVDDVARAVADTGFSRFPVRSAAGDRLLRLPARQGHPRHRRRPRTRRRCRPPQRIRRLPQVRVTDRLDVALAVLRRAGRAPRPGGRRRRAPRPGWSPWRTSSSTTSAPSATPPTAG